MGAVAGVLPDVDVLIRSAADPLLAIEHHRGFTHSLLFVLVGGVVAALAFRARGAVMAAMLAYGSHALLDAATTYGTQLFWPFSRYRVGLDVLSIIDPLFTLIVLGGAVAAFIGRRRLAICFLALALVWPAIGLVQRERAAGVQARLASERGEVLRRGAVFPTVGNTIVWRSIYETDGRLRIDRLRVPWSGEAMYASVDSVPLATADDAVRGHPRMLRDFERFAWFSDGWVARAPADPGVIGDARYSLRPDRYEPVWGIRFRAGHEPPVEWVSRTRGRDSGMAHLWADITGRNVAFRPVESRN
jgi:inner membrane protein